MTLSVTDDGPGFDAREISTGFGLVGMRDRAALVGGRVSVESAPGAGTTVASRCPPATGTTGPGVRLGERRELAAGRDHVVPLVDSADQRVAAAGSARSASTASPTGSSSSSSWRWAR